MNISYTPKGFEDYFEDWAKSRNVAQKTTTVCIYEERDIFFDWLHAEDDDFYKETYHEILIDLDRLYQYMQEHFAADYEDALLQRDSDFLRTLPDAMDDKYDKFLEQFIREIELGDLDYEQYER